MPDPIRALAALNLAPHGPVVAAVAADTVTMYDLNGRVLPDPAPFRVGRVTVLATVPLAGGGIALAAGGGEGTVRLWDPRTGQPVGESLPGQVRDVTALTVVPIEGGGCRLAAGTPDGVVLLWDPDRHADPRRLDAGLQGVFALCAVRDPCDRPLLVSAGDDDTLRLWEPVSGRRMAEQPAAHGVPITALAFLPDPRLLVSADERGAVRTWRVNNEGFESVDSLTRGHHSSVTALVAFPAEADAPPLLASAGHDGIVRRWTGIGLTPDPVVTGHRGAVNALTAVRTAEGDRLLVSAGPDARLGLWDAASGEPRFRPSTGQINALTAVTVDGSVHLAATGDDGHILLHDAVTLRARGAPLAAHRGPAHALACLPDRLSGMGLVSAGEDGRLLAWSGRDVPPTLLAENLGPLYAVADIVMPNGRPGVACAGEAGAFWVDPANPRDPQQICTGAVYALVGGELPDRSSGVAVAGEDGVIRMFRPGSPDPVARWAGHQGAVTGLARVHRVGERNSLVSAGEDGTVRLWDPVRGSQVLTRHGGRVLDLAVLDLADGRLLLVSTSEGDQVQYIDLNAVTAAEPVETDIIAVSALAAATFGGETMLAYAGDAWRIVLANFTAQYGELLFRGASDRAVSYDRLHRKHLVAVLVDILRTPPPSTPAGLPASPPVDPGPTVVAAQGAWGSGKSSVLQTVRRMLDAEPRPAVVLTRRRLTAARADVLLGRPSLWASIAGLMSDARAPLPARTAGRPASGGPAPRRVTTWFNPWAHQTSEQVWAGLTRAILDGAGQVLYPDALPHEPDDAAGARTDPGTDSTTDSSTSGEATSGDRAPEGFRARRKVRRTERHRRATREWYWLHRNRRHCQTRQLRWMLRRRLLSPLFAVAVLALLVPVVARLLDRNTNYPMSSWVVQGWQVALSLATVLLVSGAVHTIVRYHCSPAARWLPPELFAGPLPSGGQSVPGVTLPEPIRDPLHQARGGYLYLAQHDVVGVLADLQAAGYELVVFIDDLDRCSPKTTAEVLEAVNLFLSEQIPAARFVLGIDPAIVAAQLDHVYADLAKRPGALSSADPSLGWTFLRKLIQLPVVLPRLADRTVERLVDDLLRPAMTTPSLVTQQRTDDADEQSADATSTPVSESGSDPMPGAGAPRGRTTSSTIAPSPPENDEPAPASPMTDDAAAAPATDAAAGASTDPVVTRDTRRQASDVAMLVALERHPTVRTLLRERMLEQPDRSPRDIKRMLTVWQFYVRALDRAERLVGAAAVDRARDLVLVAEIVTRWPALLSRLQAPVAPDRAADAPTDWRVLDELADTAVDDVRWGVVLARSRLAEKADRPAVTALRALLRRYDGAKVAELTRRIW